MTNVLAVLGGILLIGSVAHWVFTAIPSRRLARPDSSPSSRRHDTEGATEAMRSGDSVIGRSMGRTSMALSSTVELNKTDPKLVRFRANPTAALLLAWLIATFASPDFARARTLDRTFGEDGKITSDLTSNLDAAFQPDGRIEAAGLAAAKRGGFGVARYNANGTRGTTFRQDGRMTTDFTWNKHAAMGSRGTVSTPTPIPVKTSPLDEFTPTADRGWFSWAQNSRAHPRHYDVFASKTSGTKIKINARGTEGAGGGIDGNLLVYYQYKGRRAGDVLKFNFRTRQRSRFPNRVNTRYDEFHPTISGKWLLFTRYIDKTRTTKVFLYNTATRALRSLGADSGRSRYVYSGQVNGDYAAWARVSPAGLDVFRYHIPTRSNVRIPRPVFAQYEPVVSSGGTMYFIRSGQACGDLVELVRYPVGGPASVLYDFPDGVDSGFMYADERSDGSLHLFYPERDCLRERWNIYKVVDSYVLDVSKDGTGTGTVASDQTGISCGDDCSETYHGGVNVTLTATPDTGSEFKGWSDPTCGTDLSCAVIIDADESMTATFDVAS